MKVSCPLPPVKRSPRIKKLPHRLSDASMHLYAYNPHFGELSSPSAESLQAQKRSRDVQPLNNDESTTCGVVTPPHEKIYEHNRKVRRPAEEVKHERQVESPFDSLTLEKPITFAVKSLSDPLKTKPAIFSAMSESKPPPKKRGRKPKEKAVEKLPETPTNIRYIDDVLRFFHNHNSDVDQRPIKRQSLCLSDDSACHNRKLVSREQLYQQQRYTSSSGPFKACDSDFESSDDEAQSTQNLDFKQGPSVFLIDLKQDLSETIYKKFAMDCTEYFGEEWLSTLNELLFMNAADLRWVENMRRTHIALPPLIVISKEDAVWTDERNFVAEELLRGSNPSVEDYNWILVVNAQQRNLRHKDLDLAKTYLSERGIPLEQVLIYEEEKPWEQQEVMDIDEI